MDNALHAVEPAVTPGPPGAALDVREMLVCGAAAAGPRVLLRDASHSRSGTELLESVPRIARQLAQMNGGHGQVVLIDAAPSVATVEAYWASLHAGLVPLLLPRDRPLDEIRSTLSRIEFRGGFTADAGAIAKLRELGASTGLTTASASSPSLPDGWTLAMESGDGIAARGRASDGRLCSLAIHRTSDGKAVISARSHRSVALTGLMGQFLLAPGDGEVLVRGNPGGAIFEWILHCAVMARAPVTFSGAADSLPHAADRWQLVVCQGAGASPAALREARIHDATFSQPLESEVAQSTLEVCICDSRGFLFTRHNNEADWCAAPLLQIERGRKTDERTANLQGALRQLMRNPQEGVPLRPGGSLPQAEIAPPAPADVGTLMRSGAAQRPDAPALVQDGITLTHAAFVDRASRLSTLLRTRYSVGKGDRVAFLALNRPEFFETYLGAVQLGAIFAPLNFRLSAAEVRTVLGDCMPRVLVAEADLITKLGPQAKWLPDGVQVLTMAAFGRRPCEYNAQLESVQPLAEPVQGSDEDPSSILYTTGTTGNPKGAVRSHKSVLWFSLIYAPLSLRQEPGGTHLSTPPLFHIAGHETAPVPALALGRKVVIQRRFDADKMLEDIEQHRVTSAFSPPTIAIEIAQLLRTKKYDLRSLRDWSSGSAPMSAEARDVICASAPGLRFRNSLGMTEAGGVAALQGARLFEKPATCVGQVAAGVTVRIADIDGRSLQPQTTGEIQLRSPQLLTSYWKRDSETKTAFHGGWFHTGDLGFFDTDGDLHIVGRLKDMIITGGENVYAAEVERALLAVPGVAEAAVIGVPDAKWGESVVAWIVPAASAELTQEIVVEHCRSQIAHYKCPRHYVFTSTLPRTAIGKVLKQKLRDEWVSRAAIGG